MLSLDKVVQKEVTRGKPLTCNECGVALRPLHEDVCDRCGDGVVILECPSCLMMRLWGHVRLPVRCAEQSEASALRVQEVLHKAPVRELLQGHARVDRRWREGARREEHQRALRREEGPEQHEPVLHRTEMERGAGGGRGKG